MSENHEYPQSDFDNLVEEVNKDLRAKCLSFVPESILVLLRESLGEKKFQDFKGEKIDDLHHILKSDSFYRSSNIAIPVLFIRLSHLADSGLFGDKEQKNFECSEKHRQFVVDCVKDCVQSAVVVKQALACLDAEGQEQLAISCHQNFHFARKVEIVGSLKNDPNKSPIFVNTLFSQVVIICDNHEDLTKFYEKLSHEEKHKILIDALFHQENKKALLGVMNKALMRRIENLEGRLQSALNGNTNFATTQLSEHVGREGR